MRGQSWEPLQVQQQDSASVQHGDALMMDRYVECECTARHQRGMELNR